MVGLFPTEEPENNLYGNTLVSYLLTDEMKNVGINVKTVKMIRSTML